MSNISGWTEGIIFSIAFVVTFALVIGGLNSELGRTFEVPIADNHTMDSFVSYMNTSKSQIDTGEAKFDATQGVTVKSSWSIAKGVLDILWNFFSGGWIENTAELLNLGEGMLAFAKILRIIYFISVIFAVIYIFFKVVP